MPAEEGYHFEPNPDIDEQVKGLDIIGANALDMANHIADVARSSAPVQSGAYVDGIVVQKTKSGARVFASDHKSAWLEFGVPSRGIPARWILRRAVEAAGYKFKKRSG